MKLSGTTLPCDLALKRVVADRFGGAHSFLEIAGLHYRLSLRVLGIGGPDAGIAVGLKLDLHLDRIAFVLASAGLQLLRLAECAQYVLDVMANLVCDDIGLAKSPGAWKRCDSSLKNSVSR